MQAVCANVDFTKPPNLEALPFHDEEVWGPNAHVAVSQKYMMQPRLAKKHAKFRPSTRKVILFSLSLLPPLLPIGLARRPRLPRLPWLLASYPARWFPSKRLERLRSEAQRHGVHFQDSRNLVVVNLLRLTCCFGHSSRPTPLRSNSQTLLRC